MVYIMAKNKKFLKFLKVKGIKQKALAERLGISVRAVEHWVNGRNRPSIIYLIEMSKLFKMSIESVYDIDLPPKMYLYRLHRICFNWEIL